MENLNNKRCIILHRRWSGVWLWSFMNISNKQLREATLEAAILHNMTKFCTLSEF